MPIPRKRRLFLELLESRIALSSYFVSPTGNDNNAGTSMASWLTLQHAADHLVGGCRQQRQAQKPAFPTHIFGNPRTTEQG